MHSTGIGHSPIPEPNETVVDTSTQAIQTKPKRRCTPAQLECLARNREKALEVIRTKGEKARLQKELKERYKEHVTTEREAEIERLREALAEAKPKTKAKPTPKKRKRAPSPSESESEDSPSPVPLKRKKTVAKPKPPTEPRSGRQCPQGIPSDSSSEEDADPHDARLQALHRQMFPFG